MDPLSQDDPEVTGICMMAVKPGSLTYVKRGTPVYSKPSFGSDDHTPVSFIGSCDGLICVVASIDAFRLVLTSSGRVGWIYYLDLGEIPGSNFYIGGAVRDPHRVV